MEFQGWSRIPPEDKHRRPHSTSSHKCFRLDSLSQRYTKASTQNQIQQRLGKQYHGQAVL